MINKLIYFSKLRPTAIIPSKSVEDAGYDIYCDFPEDSIEILLGETKLIPTGIASAICDEYYFQFHERGSTGKYGISTLCGVIDASYRGEWFVAINNTSYMDIIISKQVNNVQTFSNQIYYPYSKAICQAVLLPVPKVTVCEVDYDMLKSFTSIRGSGCLGSSNK